MIQVVKPKQSPLFCCSCLTSETFDPLFNHFPTGTNQWDPLPDMNEIRSDFSAVTYGSSVFAIGGFNGTDVLGGVEQFNFEEQIWRRYTSLVTPRSGTRCIPALFTSCDHAMHCNKLIWHGAGPSCTRTRCTFWAGTTAPLGCVLWSASPQDLLAPGLGGTR